MAYSLLIFARYPRLGKVKTRLMPDLAPQDCLALHEALLLDTLDRTAGLGLQRYLYLADCSEQQMREFAQKHRLAEGLRLRTQDGNNLGERMWHACRQVAPGSEGVIFLGADSPSLPLSHLEDARRKLADFPVVFGPTEDGGYYLLALSEPREDLFRDIAWGTSSVLDQTVARLEEGAYALLPSWYDVDTIADLHRLAGDLTKPLEPVPERTKRIVAKLGLYPS